MQASADRRENNLRLVSDWATCFGEFGRQSSLEEMTVPKSPPSAARVVTAGVVCRREKQADCLFVARRAGFAERLEACEHV